MPEVTGTPADFVRMRILEIEPGQGPAAQPGQKYTVHYTGWLTDGKQFDSSRTRPEPFTFVQGRRQVIGGWEAGFEGMKTGGKRRLFVPYQMAYGEKGRGIIPPKAELIFDVELLKVEDVPNQAAAQDVLNAFNEAIPTDLTPAQETRLRERIDPLIKLATNKPAPESLSASIQNLRTELEKATSGSLAREMEVEGKPSTLRGVYILIATRLAAAKY
jgi:hypothetical protein